MVRCTWSMECHWAGKTLRVLQRVVTVVPRASILSNVEPVCILMIWRYRALRHSVYSIHLHSMKLSDTMPMNCGPIILEIICDGHLQLITPACLVQGPGYCPLNACPPVLRYPSALIVISLAVRWYVRLIPVGHFLSKSVNISKTSSEFSF